MRDHLATNPADLSARGQLARLLGLQRRHDEALDEYLRLLKASPDDADFLLGAAQSFLWSGRPREALPLLRKARGLAPAYADLWHAEIQALLAIGNEEITAANELREGARRRFPERSWGYPALDEQSQTPAGVPATAKGSTQLELGIGQDRLTGNIPRWRERYVHVSLPASDTQRLHAGVREVSRYAQNDREVHLRDTWSVSPNLQLQLEVGASDTHRVLPVHYASLDASVQPATGWTLRGGLRHSRYDLVSSRVASLGLDRYVGSERLGYTLFDGGPSGSPPVPSHRIQWAHHFGNASWIGLAYGTGREAEYEPGTGLLVSKVRSIGLSGQQELSRNWAIGWLLEKVRQGDLYQRSGGQLALRYTF